MLRAFGRFSRRLWSRLRKVDGDDIALWTGGLAGAAAIALALFGFTPWGGHDLSVKFALLLLGLLLVMVLMVYRSIETKLLPALERDRVEGIFLDRASAYEAAAQLISRTKPHRQADNVIRISSLHGHVGTRRDSSDDAGASFGAAIYERLESGWHMQQFVTFTSEERMDGFLDRIERMPKGAHLEVRAAVHDDGLAAISTLIVGRQSAMLAVDDDQFFGVGSAVRLDGAEVAAWAETHHFASLWNSPSFTLWRPATGRDEDEVARLRGALGS